MMKTISFITIIAVASFVSISFAQIQNTTQSTGPFTSIDAAMVDAHSGDHFKVTGTAEGGTINISNVAFQGNTGPASDSFSSAVTLNSVTGVTLDKLTCSSGLVITGQNSLTISNSTVSFPGTGNHGLVVNGPTTLTLDNTKVTGCGANGLAVNATSTITIENNSDLSGNNSGSGLVIGAGSGSVLTISDSKLGSQYGLAVFASDTTVNVNQCEFSAVNGGAFVNIQSTGSQVTLNQPVFTGGGASLAGFYMMGKSTLTIQGTPAQKVNLDPMAANSGRIVQIFGGTLNLIDIYNSTNAHGFLSTIYKGSAFDSAINVNLNRCELVAGGGVFWVGSCAGDQSYVDPVHPFNLHATNTVWRDPIGGGGVALEGRIAATDRSLAFNYTFDHCTFTGKTKWAWVAVADGINSLTSDIVTSNYSIWDQRQTGPNFNGVNGTAGWVELAGKLNMTSGPGWAGGQPADTIIAEDPGLDVNSRLLASSPAVNAATDSTLNIDIDGKRRPSGIAADIGASEIMEALVNCARFSFMYE